MDTMKKHKKHLIATVSHREVFRGWDLKDNVRLDLKFARPVIGVASKRAPAGDAHLYVGPNHPLSTLAIGSRVTISLVDL